MAELLPCPVCGNSVRITETSVRHYGDRADYEAKIECSCGLTFEKEWIVEFRPNKTGVIIFNPDIETAWNTRTPKETESLRNIISHKEAEIERLESIIKEIVGD